jgi:glucokinase
MILVGDIGASKTLLAVGELQDGRWRAQFERRYSDGDYADFLSLLKDFLQGYAATGSSLPGIDKACFGVAGPVIAGRARLTNRGWDIDPRSLSHKCGIPSPHLINDLAAAAHGLSSLTADDFMSLQPGEPVTDRCCAVLGIGTGFGAAYRVRAGNGYAVVAGEAGHAAFAPQTAEQQALWQSLHQHKGRVEIEDVVSGLGLVNIYQHVRGKAGDGSARHAPLPEDAAAIAQASRDGDESARRAIALFIDCCAAVAGDQALSLLPRGGLYLTGGIPRRLLLEEHAARFMEVFNDKGGHAPLTRQVPVHVVTSDALNLLGCAQLAAAEY